MLAVSDIGGGTVDYVLYADGVVTQSGSLGVGGDHITHDISIVLKIPLAKAEKLKVEEGCATLEPVEGEEELKPERTQLKPERTQLKPERTQRDSGGSPGNSGPGNNKPQGGKN